MLNPGSSACSQRPSRLFTMVAVRVVMAQEQGYDTEGGGMTDTYTGLQDFLVARPGRYCLLRHGTSFKPRNALVA